jgi:muramoyltetrapeptide carboxypeptidase
VPLQVYVERPEADLDVARAPGFRRPRRAGYDAVVRQSARPLPPPLRSGDTVGIVAIASGPTARALAGGVACLESAGFRVLVAAPKAAPGAYTAGSDEERAEAAHRLIRKGARALIAARGGYGAVRVLPLLDWERLGAWGGWIVGFSDLTALHGALGDRFPAASLHGPLAVTLVRHRKSAESTFDWLRGRPVPTLFTFRPSQVVRAGIARGVSVGGNLSVLASLVGTPWEPGYDGAVLFLEDVNEAAYSLDRLLTQLRLSSRLARVSAVVVGTMSRCGLGETGWRGRWRELLAESVPAAAPIVEGLPFGHGVANHPFPLGVEVEVDTARGTVSWGGR